MRIVEYIPPWNIIFTATPTKETDARWLMALCGGPSLWQSADGPLPAKEGDQLRLGDWTPERVQEALQVIKEEPSKDGVDPVELIKFGPELTLEQKIESQGHAQGVSS